MNRVGISIVVVCVLALAVFVVWDSWGSLRQSSFDKELATCKALPNNSVQTERETTRLFINLPRDLYPSNVSSDFKTVRGNATAGYVSNGGLPGEAFDATADCSSTYFEFDGSGEVDLEVPSTAGASEYVVRFVVTSV